MAGEAGAAGVTFCGVGDVMLGREVGQRIVQEGPDYPFALTAAAIGQCDVAFLNLECPLTDAGEPLNKRFVFRGAPVSAEGLARAGFKVVSVANNHTLDQGREAFLETLAGLRKNGLVPVGGGRDQREARRPVLFRAGELRMAFLGFLAMLPDGLVFLGDRPGPAYAGIDEIEQSVREARKAADVVVVSFHWGAERRTVPTLNQIEYAHRAVDAGADLVLGHHPHVLQSVEIYRGRPIVYSLGNFVFDNRDPRQRQSIIFGCTLEKGLVSRLHAMPVIIENDRPRPASGEEAAKILQVLRAASAEFNTQFSVADGMIRIEEKTGPARSAPVPLLRSEDRDGTVLVTGDGVVLQAPGGAVLDRFAPAAAGLEISAAVPIVDADLSRLYVILRRRGSRTGGRLGVLPVDLSGGRFGRFHIDSHEHLNPWKLAACDVDGDGRAELCVGTWKPTRYDPAYENRIFVYERSGNTLYPKWFGSRLMHDVVDFSFRDVDGDGVQELLTRERFADGTTREMAYTWRTFGFSAYRDTGKPPDPAD